MDTYLILVFQDREQAQTCLDAINLMAAAYWQEQGYEVIDNGGHKELVGKNAATGADEPQAARTTTWAEINDAPDGTFYFASLSGDPRFVEWKDRLAAVGFTAIGDERPFPDEWRPESQA